MVKKIHFNIGYVTSASRHWPFFLRCNAVLVVGKCYVVVLMALLSGQFKAIDGHDQQKII